MVAPMPRFEVGGNRLWYEETGSGDAPPAVLTHSLLLDSTMWGEQVPALAEDRRVINVDVHSHGRSDDPSTGWTLEGAAGDLLTLLDELDARPAHWVGLSMGGMLGMRAALQEEEALESLVLLDTSSRPEGRRYLHQAMAWSVRIGGRPVARRLTPYVAAQMFSPDYAHRPEAEHWKRMSLEMTPRELFHGCMAVFRRSDVTDDLRDVDLPALVAVGTEDRATPPPLSETLADALPRARLERIEGAGHLSAIEEPEVVTDLVRGFLEDVDAGKGP
jgi:pimeloyl-ACP methyl ester carboxylesterase